MTKCKETNCINYLEGYCVTGGRLSNSICTDRSGPITSRSELKKCSSCDEQIDEIFIAEGKCPDCNPINREYASTRDEYWKSKIENLGLETE